MECPVCNGKAEKAMLVHEIKGVAFESEGYRCVKCGEEFDTWAQGKEVERKLKRVLEARESAVQRSYAKMAEPMPA